MLHVNVLKTPPPGQKLMSSWYQEIMFASVHVTDDVSFCDGPGMLIRKTPKPCINSIWTALLIHGFLLVKSWLLIACNTAFYAIMPIPQQTRFFFLNTKGAILHTAATIIISTSEMTEIFLISELLQNILRCDMTKPTMWLCAQRRLRSAWAFAQSDQSFRCQHEETFGP